LQTLNLLWKVEPRISHALEGGSIAHVHVHRGLIVSLRNPFCNGFPVSFGVFPGLLNGLSTLSWACFPDLPDDISVPIDP
jgi:hypothetical protein